MIDILIIAFISLIIFATIIVVLRLGHRGLFNKEETVVDKPDVYSDDSTENEEVASIKRPRVRFTNQFL